MKTKTNETRTPSFECQRETGDPSLFSSISERTRFCLFKKQETVLSLLQAKGRETDVAREHGIEASLRDLISDEGHVTKGGDGAAEFESVANGIRRQLVQQCLSRYGVGITTLNPLQNAGARMASLLRCLWCLHFSRK